MINYSLFRLCYYMWVKCLFGELPVITNLLSIVPIYGESIVVLDLGGHLLVKPTFKSFFSTDTCYLQLLFYYLLLAHLYVLRSSTF